jgi:hypothetical protein
MCDRCVDEPALAKWGRPTGLLSRFGDGRLLRILSYSDERAVGGLRVNGIGVG